MPYGNKSVCPTRLPPGANWIAAEGVQPCNTAVVLGHCTAVLCTGRRRVSGGERRVVCVDDTELLHQNSICVD